MPNSDDVHWFKSEFQPQLEPSLAGTPLTVDFMTALACQETGEIWPTLRRAGLATSTVLELCVGDTIDASGGRRAFPQTKDDLVATPNGQRMFDIARKALVDMAQYITSYKKVAINPDKFCHGYGLFQRDLQFFKSDPSYFLVGEYAKFSGTLEQALAELNRALAKLGSASRTSLSDLELAAVGIAYNTGGYKPAKGLKQGYFDGTKYYGESLFDYLRLAHTVAVDGAAPLIAPAPPGAAAVVPPTPVADTGVLMRVAVNDGMLRVRSEPIIPDATQKNVIGNLPAGHIVRALSSRAANGFLEIETSLNGALLHGFASKKFLTPADKNASVSVALPQDGAPTTGITAVFAPSKPGLITKRSGPAGALSLNEPRQPGRQGTSPDELRSELAAIVDWLDVENPAYLRYQPHDGLTFCNIYAHDFCHLAGIYLPRVWWTSKSLIELAKGNTVEPLLGSTISEVVANELFAWLRDFGLSFGWRSTGTLTKLQIEVNQGAVGVVVARRKEGNRPGHIAVVVPETTTNVAKRDGAGNVVAPLQSQAGATNFRRGTGKRDWWLGEQFAEFAFWIHA